jgi:hypothetical protein
MYWDWTLPLPGPTAQAKLECSDSSGRMSFPSLSSTLGARCKLQTELLPWQEPTFAFTEDKRNITLDCWDDRECLDSCWDCWDLWNNREHLLTIDHPSCNSDSDDRHSDRGCHCSSLKNSHFVSKKQAKNISPQCFALLPAKTN